MKTKPFLTPSNLLFGAISTLILASPGVFAAPSQPTVTQVGSDFRLSWTGNTGSWLGIDRSYPGCGGVCYENIYSAGPTGEFTDTNVSANVAYQYKVYDGTGHNGYSPAMQLTNISNNNNDGDNNGAAAVCADPTINGSTITFGDSSCWYQLQNLDSQNYNVCQGNGAQISSCGDLVPGDRYLVKRFRASPWEERSSFPFTAPGGNNSGTTETGSGSTQAQSQSPGAFPLYFDTPGITDLPNSQYDVTLAGNYFFDWFLSPYNCSPGWQGPIEAHVNGNVGSAGFFFSVDLRNDNSTGNCVHVETDIAVSKTAWRNQANGYSKKISSIEQSGSTNEANLRVTAKGRWDSDSSGRGHINMTAWLSQTEDRGTSRDIDVIIHGFDNSGNMAANDGWEVLTLDEPLMMRDAATGALTEYRIIKREGDFEEANSYNIQPVNRVYRAYKDTDDFPTDRYDMQFDVMKVLNAIIDNDDTTHLTKEWFVHDLQWTVTGQNAATVGNDFIPRIDGKWTFDEIFIPSFSEETQSGESENWTSVGGGNSQNTSSSNEVCTVVGNNFDEAAANYSSQCSLPRKDCDPVNGKWYCSSASVSSNPVVTTGSGGNPVVELQPEPEPDTEAPVVSYVTPAAEVNSGPVTISGTAEDLSGVKLFRALLQNRDQGNQRYNFSVGEFTTSTVYADTVKTIALTNETILGGDWSFTIDNLEPGRYRLRTKAWDNNNVGTTPWGLYDFTVVDAPDTQAPTLNIINPGTDVDTGAVTFSGNITDQSGIKWIRAYLLNRDQGNQRYDFSTGEFSSSTVFANTVRKVDLTDLSNETATSTDWSFTVNDLAPGRYRLRMKVWDNVNISTAWGVYDFTVVDAPDTRAPTLNITSPGTTAAPGTVTFSGNVTDQSGIKYIRAYLLSRDQGNQRYDFSTGEFSSSAVFADTVRKVEQDLTSETATSADWSFTVNDLAPGRYRLRMKVWDNINISTAWGVYDFTL